MARSSEILVLVEDLSGLNFDIFIKKRLRDVIDEVSMNENCHRKKKIFCDTSLWM